MMDHDNDDVKDTGVVHDEGDVGGGRKYKTAEERQELLAAALKQDPGVRHGSPRAVMMYLIVLVACCCSGDSGFDGTVMGGINAMKQYQTYFGMDGAGVSTSIVFGIYTIGSLTGTIPASFLPDLLGRRASMWIGNAVLIIGACVTALSHTRSVFIGGRYITGIGSALAGASAKSFLTEMSSPQDRGMYVGILNSFYYVGQITATGMMVSTGRWTSDWSWRLPLFIQVVPAALNVLFVFLCPESPRWLHTKGKRDEARRILAQLHSSTGDIHSPLIQLEMDEIEEKVAIDGADSESAEAVAPLLGGASSSRLPVEIEMGGSKRKRKRRWWSDYERFWDFRGLFKKAPGIRYRTFMVVIIGSFGQLSGNGMVTYFLPNLLVIAGIVDQNKKLTLNFVNSITSFIGALTGSFTVDRFGRRPNLINSTSMLVILLTISAALLSDPGTSPARGSAGVAMIYLFMVVFSFGWTPMQALYPAEVLPYETRAKGLAFLNIVTQASSCINTFGLPVAFQKLGWKILLIFLFWDAFEVVVLWFFIVETRGLTLEEMDEVFAQPNPVKYSVDHKFRKQMIRDAPFL